MAAAGRGQSQVRLHVVTGKGGTGKTTVAAALAIALATGGRRVLLVEVENRQGIAQLFDRPPLDYGERDLCNAPGGGHVLALAVDAENALLEYLEMFYRLGRAGRVLEKIGAIDFATTIAPGLRDVLLTGKVYEAVRRRTRRERGRSGVQTPVYDAVVLDAPPTGRITRFLNVNEEVSGIARVGPIRGQADSIMTLLRSSQTAVHVVTLLEEMPVQETADALAELTAVRLPVGAVVVNMVSDGALPAAAVDDARSDTLDAEQVRAGLRAAGLARGRSSAGLALARDLAAMARDHVARIDLEHRERAEVEQLGRPTYELPLLTAGIDLGALYALAASLHDQGMA